MGESPARTLTIRCFDEADTAAVVALWESCSLTRPWNDPLLDIQRKQAVGAELFLVGECGGTLVASVMGGYDGHRGWMNYLAVEPRLQRQGLARLLIADLESRLKSAGCPKINLQVRGENQEVIGFYQRLGYQVDNAVSLGKRLIDD